MNKLVKKSISKTRGDKCCIEGETEKMENKTKDYR